MLFYLVKKTSSYRQNVAHNLVLLSIRKFPVTLRFSRDDKV